MLEVLFIIGIIVILMIIPAPRKGGGHSRGSASTGGGGLPWMGGRKRHVNDSMIRGDDKNDDAFDMPAPMQSGDSEIEKVVKAHADCTAEVFKVAVIDRTPVENAKWLINPGDPVTLKKYKTYFKVLGHSYTSLFYLGNFYPGASSMLPRLFADNIPFDAYLCGRDSYQVTDNVIFISIIVFYRIDGIPPTKVNIHI